MKITTIITLIMMLLVFGVRSAVVDLEWRTKSESNNDYFTIERSLNGTNWTQIGKIDGQGSTTVEHLYVFTDENAPKGTIYYCLKQTDFDGKTVTSKIISINNNNEDIANVIVYPNPAVTYISLLTDEKIFIREIVNSKKSSVINNISINESIINVQNLTDGIYYVVYENENGKLFTVSFIKK